MKKSQFAVFLTIVLSVYTLVNYYIFITGLNSIPDNYKFLYSAIYLFFFLSYIIGRFLEHKFLNTVSAFFVWVGSFWLGAMVYYLLFVILIDVIRLLNAFFGFLSASFYTNEYQMLFFLIVNAAVIVILVFGYLNAVSPVIKRLNINIGKKAGLLRSLNIVMASDIHLGTIINRKRLRKIVNMINSLEPDLILLPGDVVDEDIESVVKQNCGEDLRALRAKYGVFAITGNHEYIGGVEPSVRYLTEHGIIELRDRAIKIANSFYIIGREDRASKGFAGILRKPLNLLLEGVDKNLPVILMDHQPVKLEEAENNGIDLQLSGHTHHGQLWPFNFITKKIYEVSMGYKQKGDTHYYISPGVGTWGPPVRTGNKPEIIQITLNFAA
ncbi:MAG TPA: metallophosphoesterase [Ignavibacteria bacterium]|mgnify:CR=1 FL=1|nr:metallophosphoesterase [Ignavibacteria bacterium]HMQ98298.1 metallophosphoesterase [Ignavibacteria bacterium]